MYFETNSVDAGSAKAYAMYKLTRPALMILNERNIWVEAEPEDYREINMSKNMKEFLMFNVENYNKIIGFIGYGKNNSYMVFKTKVIAAKRDTGARCDESGKIKTIQKLNEILGETKYTTENTRAKKDEEGNVISDAIGHVELCVLQEFILRYFNAIQKDGKKWFLTPEMALIHKLYTVFV